ncbi:MAG: hypothetical protein EBQ92_04830 [Proteobacteria bacterium]|nr:hypothetical protein [Pseudomonadota bacterium]
MTRICSFFYSGPTAELEKRQLLGLPLLDFHQSALHSVQSGGASRKSEWQVKLGKNLLFNSAALRLIEKALQTYQGEASEIELYLKVDESSYRHFYSLQSQVSPQERVLSLPIEIRRERAGSQGKEKDKLVLDLPSQKYPIQFPASLCEEREAPVPQVVLIPFESEFDILFANQIAILNGIEEGVRQSPTTWMRSLLRRTPKKWSRRVALSYRKIHPTAEVHPTAVVEGSIIGPGVQVGAHCVVRFSKLGADTKLYDGAKVEFSVVGSRCWLMHDLVLYRSYVEDDVFLIHGPYQFSGFQNKSSAFATILMDYRPDRKPIRVVTPKGRKEYQGPFLGSILKEGAKTLGGSLIAPGLIIPEDLWLSADSQLVHRQPSPGNELINSQTK